MLILAFTLATMCVGLAATAGSGGYPVSNGPGKVCNTIDGAVSALVEVVAAEAAWLCAATCDACDMSTTREGTARTSVVPRTPDDSCNASACGRRTSWSSSTCE